MEGGKCQKIIRGSDLVIVLLYAGLVAIMFSVQGIESVYVMHRAL